MGASQAQYLNDILAEVCQEESELHHIGHPMLAGAVATTRDETEALKGDEEHFVRFVQDSNVIINQLTKKASDLQCQSKSIHASADEQERRLAREQNDNEFLVHRLDSARSAEEHLLSTSSRDMISLTTEERACQQRYVSSCNMANVLNVRLAELRAEKQRLHSVLASSSERFHEK